MTHVYSLNDPVTEAVTYVGHTTNPLIRFGNHLRDRNYTHPKNRWITGLISRGLLPVMNVLEIVPISQANHTERQWIQFFGYIGFDLLNTNNGGPGVLTHSAQTRDKMSAALSGRKLTPNHKKHLSEAKLGRPLSAAHRMATSLGKKGKRLTEAHKASLKAAWVTRKGKRI